MTPKPVSIQLWTVRDKMGEDAPAVLKQIAEIGYDAVEPAGLAGMTPAAFRKVLDDVGLKCSSAHMGLTTKENLNETVDTAKALGIKIVVSGKGPGDFETLDAIKAGAEQFQAAAELLKPHGLKAGYHNHWWEFNVIDGKLGHDLFLDLAPDVVPQVDLYWACNFGAVDVPAFVRKHASRIALLHVKDGPLVQGVPHTAVGDGKMDIPACIDAADPKVLQWLIVELDDCATDMMEAVARSCKYLKGAGLAQ